MTAGPTTTCTGITPSGSSSNVAFTGAVTDSSCTVSATVEGVQAGSWPNPVTVTIDGAQSDISASIDVVAPPSLGQAFGTGSIPLGGTTLLTFTLSNPNAGDQLTGVGFTDQLPSGLAVAQMPNATDTCGGSFTPAAGGSSLTVSGGTIAPSSSCTISLDVTGTQEGTQTNTTSAVSSNEGGAGNAANPEQIDVVPDAPPTLAAAFSPSDLQPGETTTLTFTIGNPGSNPIDATNVSFNDTLPSGLTVPSGSTTVCGGTLTTTSPTTISFSGGTRTPGTQCQFPVSVTGVSDGNYTNTTGAISSTEGGSGAPASAPLTVAAPPSIAEAFGTPAIGQGASTSLTFTIANPNSSVTLTGIGFSDTLPSALPVATPSALTNTCGGSPSAAAGASSVTLTDGRLGAGATCTVSLRVLGTAPGRFTSSTSPVGSNEGGAGNGTQAAITVIGPPQVMVTAPTPGANYAFGQKIHAAYSCADDPNGPGISSCTGDVPNGALIDTSKAGLHIFTVTAMSQDGGNSSDLVFYTVGPDSRFKLLNVRVRPNGSLVFRIKLPGAGRVSIVETARGRPKLVFARRQARVTHATTLRLVVGLDARGRRALGGRTRLPVSVSVGYTPLGGTERTVRFRLAVRP